MKKQKISDAVIHRLPRYYRYLDDLYNKGVVRISSNSLGAKMDITASQIRQDLSCFGEFGQQGYGYNVKKLRYEIREILGLNSRNTAVLVGCGNMGQALLKNFDFEACGFYMVAAFDQDPDKIATQVGPVRVLDVGVLRRFVEAEKPCMAVLTVPRDAAPGMAKLLGEIGIQAIWNFTGCKLEEPDVLVEDVSFSSSLLTLSYRLNQKKEERELSSESSPNGSHGIG